MRYPLFLRITAMMLMIFLCIPLLCGCSKEPMLEGLQTETVPAETEPVTEEYFQPEPSVIVETLSLREAYNAFSDGTITRTEFFRQPDAKSLLDAFYDETLARFLHGELTELPGIEEVSPSLFSSYQIDSGVPHLVGFAEKDSDCFLIPCTETVLTEDISVVPGTGLPILTDTGSVYSLDFLEIRFSEQFDGDTLIFTPTSIRFGNTFDSLCACIPDNAASVRLFQDTWSYGTAAAEYLYIETDNDFELWIRYMDSLDFRKVDLTVPEEKRYDRRWINVFQPCYDRRYNTSVITVGLDDGLEWEYLTYNFVIPEVGYPTLTLEPVWQPEYSLIYVHYARRYQPSTDSWDHTFGILHPIEFPNRNSPPIAETPEELDSIGFRDDDPRLLWFKAFLSGNTAMLEYLSDAPEGVYAPLGTLKPEKWFCYRYEDVLHCYWFQPETVDTTAPLSGFDGLTSFFSIGAYPWGTGISNDNAYFTTAPGFAELTDFLDNTTITYLPENGADLNEEDRSSFTEYLCRQLCTGETATVTAEELTAYAEQRFSVKNFLPSEDNRFENVLGEYRYQARGTVYPKHAYMIIRSSGGTNKYSYRVRFCADPGKLFQSGLVEYTFKTAEDGSVIFRSCKTEHDPLDCGYPPFSYQ